MSILTTEEFNTVFNKAVKSFANANRAEVLKEMYGMRAKGNYSRLWLYLYTLNSWDNTNITNNYITEAQMLKLISKVQQNA